MQDIRNAKKSIFMQYFIVDEGYMWDTILTELKKKAAEGVDVRIIYDGFGTLLTLPQNYEKQLEGLGLEEATDYTTAFTGEVDFTNVELNVDVFIGDIVTIENTNWGTPINTRLIEVIESIAEDGTYSAIPTFGI